MSDIDDSPVHAAAERSVARNALKYLSWLAVAAVIGLMLYVGDPTTLSWWFMALPFAPWIAGPVVVPYFLATRLYPRIWFTHAVTAYLFLSCALAATAYYRAFFVSKSSTAALVMVFIPLYQWVSLTVVGLIALVLRNRSGRRN